MGHDLRPTAEQAEVFATCLEVCIPAELAVAYLLPELEREVIPELARRWTKDARVRAARFDLREWIDKTPEARQQYGLDRAYNGMAALLAFETLADADGPKLAKLKWCVEVLEKKLAGKAGVSDPLSTFFEQFQREAVKAAKLPRVQ